MSRFLKAVLATRDAEHEANLVTARGHELPKGNDADVRTLTGRELTREAILRVRREHSSWSPVQIAEEVECSPVTVRKVLRVAESSWARVVSP